MEINPLIASLRNTSAKRVPVNLKEQVLSKTDSIMAQASGTKTSEQHVYMYTINAGGYAEELTHLQAYITFSYDGTNATITDEAGWCWGSQPSSSYEWVVDDCWGTVYRGPDTRVYFESNGEYHCDPASTFPCNNSDPDGYYHTLTAEEVGFGDGTSQCVYGYSGDVMAGVDRTIIQGCN